MSKNITMSVPFREDFQNIDSVDYTKQRVTQTNMVYLIGLAETIADEQKLADTQFCGQYGDIIRVLVKENYFNDRRSYCAYITYTTEEAAALAIIAINNVMIDGSRIYASYGTNKYCSGFLRCGKCRKTECPFLHRIDRQKEIRQQDNKKLFQEQQTSARSYVVANLSKINFSAVNNNIFPSLEDVKKRLIQQGLIEKNAPIQMKIAQCNFESRQNSPRLMKNMRSEASTEASPVRDVAIDSQSEQIIEKSQPCLLNRILHKISCSKKSMFGFVPTNQSLKEVESQRKRLQSYFVTPQINC